MAVAVTVTATATAPAARRAKPPFSPQRRGRFPTFDAESIRTLSAVSSLVAFVALLSVLLKTGHREQHWRPSRAHSPGWALRGRQPLWMYFFITTQPCLNTGQGIWGRRVHVLAAGS